MSAPIIKRGYKPGTWIKLLDDDYTEYIYVDEDGKYYHENKTTWFTCTHHSSFYSKDSYLPSNYHYYGMNKIKGGKGYRPDGHPVGIMGGPCPECDGTIISLKMNTSRKGFETTSEKVCDTCGLTIPGAFQCLEPKGDYKAKHYDTHEAWIEDNCIEKDYKDDDVAWDAEAYAHATGNRLNTSDDVGYGDDGPGFANKNDHNPRLAKAIWRLSNTPQSMKIPKSERDNYYYRELAKDYGVEFGLAKFQVDEVLYILEHRGNLFKMKHKADDIILCITLVVLSCYVNNGYMATIKRQIPMWKKKYSTLYQTIRDKLNV